MRARIWVTLVHAEHPFKYFSCKASGTPLLEKRGNAPGIEAGAVAMAQVLVIPRDHVISP
jgi:hypothetical protein